MKIIGNLSFVSSDSTRRRMKSAQATKASGPEPTSSRPSHHSLISPLPFPPLPSPPPLTIMSENTYKHLTDNDDYAALLSSYDVWLFDCDGVLWSGDDLIPGAVSVLEKLRKWGKQIAFVTNNASKSRSSYLKKFEKLGIKASVVSMKTKDRGRGTKGRLDLMMLLPLLLPTGRDLLFLLRSCRLPQTSPQIPF